MRHILLKRDQLQSVIEARDHGEPFLLTVDTVVVARSTPVARSRSVGWSGVGALRRHSRSRRVHHGGNRGRVVHHRAAVRAGTVSRGTRRSVGRSGRSVRRSRRTVRGTRRSVGGTRRTVRRGRAIRRATTGHYSSRCRGRTAPCIASLTVKDAIIIEYQIMTVTDANSRSKGSSVRENDTVWGGDSDFIADGTVGRGCSGNETREKGGSADKWCEIDHCRINKYWTVKRE